MLPIHNRFIIELALNYFMKKHTNIVNAKISDHRQDHKNNRTQFAFKTYAERSEVGNIAVMRLGNNRQPTKTSQ